MDPDSTGLNPAWRKSLVFTGVSITWQDGASLTEIQAARQLLIQEMNILKGIAPESGAYLNEVRESYAFRPHSLQPHFLFLSGFEIRTRLEEILLRDSLRQAASHQAKVRSEITLPHLRRYWIGRVGRRSCLPSMKPLLRIPPLALAPRGAWRVRGFRKPPPVALHHDLLDSTYLAFAVIVSPTLLVVPTRIVHSQTPLRGLTIARDRSTNPGRSSHPFRMIRRFGAG